MRMVVAGGSAGLLAGVLARSRVTGDCDVMWSGGEGDWAQLTEAAGRAAAELGLPAMWLNRDCSMYAWCLPIAWESRCERVGVFGALDVWRLSRLDLVASKVMSSPKRPHDVEDLRAMRPSGEELDFAESNIDRLESEHLDGAEFADQRAVVRALRSER